jgi:hypothetical protein
MKIMMIMIQFIIVMHDAAMKSMMRMIMTKTMMQNQPK